MVIIGSAKLNERSSISGGKPGDQKQAAVPDVKGEVSMQAFYNHKKGWNVLRAKDKNIANKIADNMIIACNNPAIGYDQGATRLGVVNSSVKTTIPTGCDCSSLVRACVREATGKDPGNFNTANEVAVLAKTGLFNPVFTYTPSTKLQKGDILVTKVKGHTVIVVEVNNF